MQDHETVELRDILSRSPAPLFAWLGWYIPRRRLFFSTAGSCQSRVRKHRRICGGLPLMDNPGCAISWRHDGGISSRAAPFPMIGKGWGDRVERSIWQRRGYYEFFKQSLWKNDERKTETDQSYLSKGTKGDAMRRLSLLAGDRLRFLFSFACKRALMCWQLGRKNALFSRGFGHSFRKGNTIPYLVLFSQNTFHIFLHRLAGGAVPFYLLPRLFLLWDRLSQNKRLGVLAPGRRQKAQSAATSGHFVPKLAGFVEAPQQAYLRTIGAQK